MHKEAKNQIASAALSEEGFQILFDRMVFYSGEITPVGIIKKDQFSIIKKVSPRLAKNIFRCLCVGINFPVVLKEDEAWNKVEKSLKAACKKIRLIPKPDPHNVGRSQIHLVTSKCELLPLGEIAIKSKVMIVSLPLRGKEESFDFVRKTLQQAGFRSAN